MTKETIDGNKTIRISKSNFVEIGKFGRYGNTFDECITILLEQYNIYKEQNSKYSKELIELRRQLNKQLPTED